MLNGWKGLASVALRFAVRLQGRRASSVARKASDQELLDAVLEALNIARDNKALVVAREGTIININKLASQLCGRSQEELAGKSVTIELFEQAPAQYCGAPIERWETALKTASDGPIAVEVVRQPLGTRLAGVEVYAVRDLRERREAAEERDRQNKALQQREKELHIQNMRFDTALNNMSQGLAMFDAEQRLVVCNRLYAELYGLTPEQVKPGTTIRQLLKHRHAKGLFGNVDFETFVREWLAEFSKGSSRIQELADGRVISIVRRPMLDGGLVSSTEDITERQKLNALLEQQNLRFDVALKNMSQGLCMFDAEQRLLVSNERYAKMYGLTSEQVKPGTTFRQILEFRIAMGAYVGNAPEEYINERLSAVREGVASTKIHELSDGRVIAILHQPMADGGWVATHQDITEQRRSDAKIAHMALHDALTSLPNRVLLNERLEHALTRIKRGEIVAAHLLDLDHFKNVNDTLGHPAGDKLLKMVADRLRALAGETDTIARMGGDEFAVVQLAIAQPSDATVLAQQIIEVVSEPYDIDGHQVIIGTSVGIAVGPADGLSPDQLMRNADLALYRAKGKGRGMYRFFEPEMDTQMQARRVMENDLRKALVAGEFELHYQPVVNLEHNEISGFEALVRWHHPEKGMISPGEFIPLAEENGFIVQLGEWTLRSACATAAEWPDEIEGCRQPLPCPVQEARTGASGVQRADRVGLVGRNGWSSRSPRPFCWRTTRLHLPCCSPASRARRADSDGRLRHGLFLA